MPKQFRASAFGAYVLFIHLVGEAIAPAVIGTLSDHYGLRAGLQFATFFVLLGGICFIPVVLIMKKKQEQLDYVS